MNTFEPHFNLHHGPYSVYLFEFPNGKVYVGKCKHKPEKRWKGKYNKKITEAFKTARGRQNVKKTVLRTGLSEREVGYFEAYYACVYKAYTNGYNVRPAGRSGSVTQIDMETFGLVKTFDSANQAERALGIPRQNILAAVKGTDRHSAGGFYWCYAWALCLPEHLRRIQEERERSAIAHEGGKAY